MRYQLVEKPHAVPTKGLLPFRGGITEVHRNKQLQETLVTVVYDDQDTDTVPFNAMLEETAFNNHQDKKVRLHTLSKRRLATPETGQANPEEVQQWVSRHALKKNIPKTRRKGSVCPNRRRQTRAIQDAPNATSKKKPE